MSTTLNNILGVSGKPKAPYTPPGIDSSLPGAAAVQRKQGAGETQPPGLAPGINGAAASQRRGGEATARPGTPMQAGASPAQVAQGETGAARFQGGVQPASISGLVPKEELKKTIPAASAKPRRLSYEELFKLLNPYKPPTQEELEKERKKQKREQIFAAIGDGISALSNLYFTTQYAPNMYSGRNTASQRVKDRWDKLAADRNANMTAYINGLMRARQADDAYDYNERQWARQLGLDKIKQQRDAAADKRAEAEEERKKTLHPFDVRAAEGKAKVAEAEAKYAEEYQRSRITQNEAAAGASNAAAGTSRARARSGKKKNMQEAYDYWMSLTDEQKNQYRNLNNRYRKVKTGTDDDDNPIFTNQYMDDDDDFIQMVWEQRQGWLRNNSPDGKKRINGFGSDNSGKKKIEGFGS